MLKICTFSNFVGIIKYIIKYSLFSTFEYHFKTSSGEMRGIFKQYFAFFTKSDILPTFSQDKRKMSVES